MHSASVAFGQRVVLLGDTQAALPGTLSIPPGTVRPQRDHPRTARSGGIRASGGASTGSGRERQHPTGSGARRGGVFLPGPGTTVAARAQRAVDPVTQQFAASTTGWWGTGRSVPDEADAAVAQRLCLASRDRLRHATATLAVESWRHQIQHCPAGPRLATLLDWRPERLRPAPGTGRTSRPRVQADGSTSKATPADARWANAVLDGITARQRLIAHLQAQQYTDIAELSGCYPGIHQFLATELALALHTTDAEGSALLGAAEALRDRLPDTRAALSEGRIDDEKAMAILRATANCTAQVAHAVELKVLPDAEKVTATTVRRRAGRAVIAADPDGAADRHRRARTERHVWRAPDQDGMARFGIYAPAQDVDTIWRAITAVADAIKQPGDTRGLGQRRADAMIMICSDILGAGGWQGLRLPDKHLGKPRINVTVPYTVLLGHRAPCELAGYGPVPTEQALASIGAGDLHRLLTDPESGLLLDYGHQRYRPPPHLAEFVGPGTGNAPCRPVTNSLTVVISITSFRPNPIRKPANPRLAPPPRITWRRHAHTTTSARTRLPPAPRDGRHLHLDHSA